MEALEYLVIQFCGTRFFFNLNIKKFKILMDQNIEVLEIEVCIRK